MEELQVLIEQFLIDTGAWNVFIEEQGTNFENSILTINPTVTDLSAVTRNTCLFDVEFSYAIIQEEDNTQSVHSSGLARFSSKNGATTITSIEAK
jgi:hypothetical protein